MTTQTFELTVPTSALINANHRTHWRVKANKVSAIRGGFDLAARLNGFLPMSRAHAVCHLSFGDDRRRDPNNWSDTAKAAIDGCVDAGVLEDDDHKHLVGPDMRIGPVGKRGEVTISLTFKEIA